MKPDVNQSLLGCLLGTAVGDALGLPAEGLSRGRLTALGLGSQHRLLFGRGMFSDDTEHTLMLASSLIEHGNDVTAFRRSLAWKMRWWLLALPAGVGMSTAKAILRLWVGFPSDRSGVLSGGNGAAMRSAIVGAFFHGDEMKRREFALASCRITHRGIHAEESALLVAEAAALAARGVESVSAVNALERLAASNEMKNRFQNLRPFLHQGRSVSAYAVQIDCEEGVSGFAPNTVSVALYAWLRHRGDFERAIRAVIECGGDTDTVAAITGGIMGAESGPSSIPQRWLDGICDWPRSPAFIHRVATSLAMDERKPPSLCWPVIPLRNLVFLAIVLGHGFRRLLPPY